MFIPTIDMNILKRIYVRWIRDDKPDVDSSYVDKILYADAELMAHLYWFDDMIEFERLNMGHK